MQVPLFCTHSKYWVSRRYRRCLMCVPMTREEMAEYVRIKGEERR